MTTFLSLPSETEMSGSANHKRTSCCHEQTPRGLYCGGGLQPLQPEVFYPQTPPTCLLPHQRRPCTDHVYTLTWPRHTKPPPSPTRDSRIISHRSYSPNHSLHVRNSQSGQRKKTRHDSAGSNTRTGVYLPPWTPTRTLTLS